MSLVADERTATRVGAVALFLALAGVVLVVGVLPRMALSRAVHVRVYYTELAGMREGAPVRSAGEVIGRVEAIAFVPAGRPGPLGGQVGAAVHLALHPELIDRAWRDGEYIISSRGPLSARYVEILPPRRGPSQGPVTEGAELRGVDPPTLDRVLQQTWTNLMIARRFFADVGPEARQLRGELAQLTRTWREVVAGAGGDGDGSGDQVDQLMARWEQLVDEAERGWQDVLGGRPGLEHLQAVVGNAAATARQAAAAGAELSRAIERLRGELARIEAQLAAAAPSVRLAALIARAGELAGKLVSIARSVQVVQERWERREGTLGRLLSDPEFPEDAKELGKILKREPWRIFGHPPDE